MFFFIKNIKSCLIFFLLLIITGEGLSQRVEQYVSDALKIQQRTDREILYLHTDKSSYLVGDTIWFAAYLVSALDYMPSQQSGIAYIELITPTNGIEKRLAIHLVLGHGMAQIPLEQKVIPGTYRIRAYTRWMQNLSDSLFFQKDIPIVGGEQNWLMNIHSYQQLSLANSDSIHMLFSLKDQSGNPADNKPVLLSLTNSRGKTILSQSITTNTDGSLNAHFNVEKNKRNNQLTLHIADQYKITRAAYPIPINLANDTLDVQFLPESGHLIAAMDNTMAFKAIKSDGTGADITGTIQDSKGNIVTSFATGYKGMGTFSFTPKIDEQYNVMINGRSYTLPITENMGTIVHVDALSNKDSILVDLNGTQDAVGQYYFLFGKSKGMILYGSKLLMKTRNNRLAIDKKIFPNGVNSFTLTKMNGQILNERMFFVNQYDSLKIAFLAPQNTIRTGDSVPVHLKITDQDNNPIQGIFSLAITDNQQVKKDPRNDENIISYALLHSELKGSIETPGYYFSNINEQKQKALDALMLTQGFVQYNWDTTKMVIPAERQFEIGGKASTLFGKPLKNARITLLSQGKETFIMDTVADEKGRFTFNNFPLFDSSTFFVQARNKKDKSFGIGIELDHSSFPVVNDYNFQSANRSPANINVDTNMQNHIRQYDKFYEKKYGKRTLLDVTVTTKARIDGSANLNGPGQYDQAITQSELQQMRDTTLLQILQSRLKGFNPGTCGRDRTLYYMLNGNKVRFVFDGIGIDFFYNEESIGGTINPYYQFVTNYLKYYTAKDIKGIEVMQSSRYSSNYINTYLTSDERLSYNPAMGCPFTYIEITTYGKQGPFLRHNATADVLRPQPFSYGKISYQPKYINRRLQDSLPDVRSTLYWNPLIITDKNGEAQCAFYSASTPTDYLLWLEGMDLNGHFGFATKKVGVNAE